MAAHRYTSHLEAAYMEQAHGVRFEADNLTIADPSVLEGQPGDLILIARGTEAHRLKLPAKLDAGERIIMRDGKPFHWPHTIG